jgi:hypothetical protein
VKYIQELLKEKKSPMECTPLTGLGRDSVPKITVHHYAKDSALREPHSTSEAESDILPEELPEEFPEFNTVEDLRQWLGIDDNTPSEDLSPEEELLGSPEEELLAEFNLELLGSPQEELLGSPEEELLAEFNFELLGSPEEELLPEFNWTEDLRQYLEL